MVKLTVHKGVAPAELATGRLRTYHSRSQNHNLKQLEELWDFLGF
jgi:hypothetical protein